MIHVCPTCGHSNAVAQRVESIPCEACGLRFAPSVVRPSKSAEPAKEKGDASCAIAGFTLAIISLLVWPLGPFAALVSALGLSRKLGGLAVVGVVIGLVSSVMLVRFGLPAAARVLELQQMSQSH